ncbi:MAG: GxxExxY protein [Candidatus Omnitrophica bacterium]|nr:GxxExxY protein [Candidatus Omnitrophota bacterium]
MENKDPLTKRIIACCFRIHNELGPGFNEKIYRRALKIALKEEGLECETEKEFQVFFQNKKVGSLRLDLIVENRVIVETKALPSNIPDVFMYQVLSYLKVSGLNVGLLVNFGNKSCHVKRYML